MFESIAQKLSQSPEVAFYALSFIVLALIVWVILLERRISRLLSGKNAQNLEDSIINNRNDLNALKTFQKMEKINPDGIPGPDTYKALHNLGLDQDIIDKAIAWIGKLF